MKGQELPVEQLEPVTEASSTRHAEGSHRSLCPRCGHKSLKRKPREGMLHRWISPIFGYYPWRCTACGGNFLTQRRAAKTGKNSQKSNQLIAAPNESV